MPLLFRSSVTLTCKQCGKEFVTHKSKAEKGQQFCSSACYNLARGERIACRCEVCGQAFQLRPADISEGQGRFCSWKCYNQSRIKRVLCQCPECGKEFEARPSELAAGRGKYCSVACSRKATGRRRRREESIYTCEVCGKIFEAKLTPAQTLRNERRFCSKACFDQARRNRIERKCGFCGKTFEVIPANVASGRGRYCSKECCDKGASEAGNMHMHRMRQEF
jgi:hypothetical protein